MGYLFIWCGLHSCAVSSGILLDLSDLRGLFIKTI